MLQPRAEPALTGLLAKIRAATSASKAGPGAESPGARAIVDTRGEVARVGPKSIDRGDRHGLRKEQNPRRSRRSEETGPGPGRTTGSSTGFWFLCPRGARCTTPTTGHAPPPPPPPPADLAGTWKAQPGPGLAITLTLGADGAFTWAVAEKGKTQTLQGQAGFQDGVLALNQEQGRRWSERSVAKATTRSASSRPTHPTP